MNPRRLTGACFAAAALVLVVVPAQEQKAVEAPAPPVGVEPAGTA